MRKTPSNLVSNEEATQPIQKRKPNLPKPSPKPTNQTQKRPRMRCDAMHANDYNAPVQTNQPNVLLLLCCDVVAVMCDVSLHTGQ